MGQVVWSYNGWSSSYDRRAQRNGLYGVRPGAGERSEAVKMHCIIHQEALCAKTAQLSDVMNTVVKTVNIIRVRALYHREFQTFLPDVDAECGDLLYHSEVRWLSRGSVLRRFYSLRSEIDQFLKEKDRPLHELSDPLWLADLASLVDVTEHLNTLNKNLQGKDQLIPQLHTHMKAFCVSSNCLRHSCAPSMSRTYPHCPKSDLRFQGPISLIKRGNMCL